MGLERTGGFETVAFCEIDPFCQNVLKKHWPDTPIYNDVRTLDYDGAVDVITGGFPCQPFSVAGKQKGQDDDRHLWPAMFDLVKKYRPSWIIGENVSGLITLGLDDVLADLESEGYSTRTFVVPACAVGAPHRRDRLWIVGYAEHHGQPSTKKRRIFTQTNDDNPQREEKTCQFEGSTCVRGRVASDTNNFGCEGGEFQTLQGQPTFSRESTRRIEEWRKGWPISTPRICGVDDGIPDRTHRIKSLGNAVIPQIPEMIGNAILQAELTQS